MVGEAAPPWLAVSEGRRRSAPDAHMPSNPHPTEIPDSPEVSKCAKNLKKTWAEKERALRILLPAHRKKAALPIPAVVPDDPAAYFIWPDAEPDGRLLGVLRAVCDRVTYLGRSRSLVRVSVADDPPPATHVADSGNP